MRSSIQTHIEVLESESILTEKGVSRSLLHDVDTECRKDFTDVVAGFHKVLHKQMMPCQLQKRQGKSIEEECENRFRRPQNAERL